MSQQVQLIELHVFTLLVPIIHVCRRSAIDHGTRCYRIGNFNLCKDGCDVEVSLYLLGDCVLACSRSLVWPLHVS